MEDPASILIGTEIVILVCIGIVAGFASLFNKEWAKPAWVIEGAIFILFTLIDIVMLPKIWPGQ